MTPFTLPQLQKRREQICNSIAGINTMRKGSFSQFSYKKTLKDGTVKQHGPFFRITKKDERGKTVTIPVPKAEVPYYEKEVANYQELRKLTDELADVCEQISILSHGEDVKKK